MRLARPAGVETVRLQRGPKPTLDYGAFAFALRDFWKGTATNSATLSFSSLMLPYAAPGAVFLLDEPGLHERLDELCSRSRRFVLRGDGAGGLDLTGAEDPLRELERLAWS